MFDEWRTRGVRFHHPLQTGPWGGAFTRFDDLDGNSFGLVEWDEFVARHETDARAGDSIKSAILVKHLFLGKGEPTSVQTLDLILGTLAEAALLFTSAQGAAVGLRRHGEMVCLGRSARLHLHWVRR